MNLTPLSAALLVKIISEAEYENDDTGMNDALLKFTSAERGNLADLKKKGFVETSSDEGGYIWCILQETARPLYEGLKKC